jgi:hypothetical protein
MCQTQLHGQKSAEQQISLQQMARMILILKMDVISSSEISVHIRTAGSYIAENVSIHYYRCENLKPVSEVEYNAQSGA